jgi:hypothetical protein
MLRFVCYWNLPRKEIEKKFSELDSNEDGLLAQEEVNAKKSKKK